MKRNYQYWIGITLIVFAFIGYFMYEYTRGRDDSNLAVQVGPDCVKITYCNDESANESYEETDDEAEIIIGAEVFDFKWIEAYLSTLKNITRNSNDTDNSFYSLMDINQDKQPELFLNYRGTKTLVFSYSENKLITLGEVSNGIYLTEEADGFISYGGFGTGVGGAYLYQIENNAFKKKEISTYVVDGKKGAYYTIEGEEVALEVFELYMEGVLKSPLILQPVSKALTEENLHIF